MIAPFQVFGGDGGDGFVRVINLSSETITVGFYECRLKYRCHEVDLKPLEEYTYGYQWAWSAGHSLEIQGWKNPSGYRPKINQSFNGNRYKETTDCVYWGVKELDTVVPAVKRSANYSPISCFPVDDWYRHEITTMIEQWKKEVIAWMNDEPIREAERQLERKIEADKAKIEAFKTFLMNKNNVDLCLHDAFVTYFTKYGIDYCPSQN